MTRSNRPLSLPSHHYKSIHQVMRGSSSNSISDILLTRAKCLNLQRTITHEILFFFFKIYSKVNQIIYLSLPINSSSLKALAPTVFFRYFADKVKIPKTTKGDNKMHFCFSELIKKVIYSSLGCSSSFKAQALIVF